MQWRGDFAANFRASTLGSLDTTSASRLYLQREDNLKEMEFWFHPAILTG